MYKYMYIYIYIYEYWTLCGWPGAWIYRICLLNTSWGVLRTPWGSLWTPCGRSEDLINFCANTCSNFSLNSAVEINILNMWTNTRVQFSSKLVVVNQIYMNIDDQLPTQKCPNHSFYEFKWCCWNSRLSAHSLHSWHSLHSSPEMESSRAAPSLGRTRARGHDDDS